MLRSLTSIFHFRSKQREAVDEQHLFVWKIGRNQNWNKNLSSLFWYLCNDDLMYIFFRECHIGRQYLCQAWVYNGNIQNKMMVNNNTVFLNRAILFLAIYPPPPPYTVITRKLWNSIRQLWQSSFNHETQELYSVNRPISDKNSLVKLFAL